MSIVLNASFHCFCHCSAQKIRPEFLKMWFPKDGTLLYREIPFSYHSITGQQLFQRSRLTGLEFFLPLNLPNTSPVSL